MKLAFVDRISGVRRQIALRHDESRYRGEYLNKAVLSYPPRNVTIGITSACNNRCVFCAYHSEDAKGTSKVYGLDYELSLGNFRRMVSMCYQGRVPRVHICGTGEPFLHKDIISMIDYVIEVYGVASVQTNFVKPVFDKKNYIDELTRRAKHISYITTDVLSGEAHTHEVLKKGSQLEDVLAAMEYLSKHAGIHFEAHCILTKHNYRDLPRLVQLLAERGIDCHLAIVNLHAYGFNVYTDPSAVYASQDVDIAEVLGCTKAMGEELGIQVAVPSPMDAGHKRCGSFWTRFQTWPVAGVDIQRYAENIIVGGCNAVVLGGLSSLGYFFDYGDIMSLWNNEHFVRIRTGLLQGIYPSDKCTGCQNYDATRRELES